MYDANIADCGPVPSEPWPRSTHTPANQIILQQRKTYCQHSLLNGFRHGTILNVLQLRSRRTFIRLCFVFICGAFESTRVSDSLIVLIARLCHLCYSSPEVSSVVTMATLAFSSNCRSKSADLVAEQCLFRILA